MKFAALQLFPQIFIAKLKDDEALGPMRKDVDDFDYVLALEFLQAPSLVFLQFIHLFGGYLLSSQLHLPFPDLSIGSPAQQVLIDDYAVFLEVNVLIDLLHYRI